MAAWSGVRSGRVRITAAAETRNQKGQRRPAQCDERRNECESDDGRAHVLPAGPAKPADQRGDDLLEWYSDVRFGPAGKSGVDPTGEIFLAFASRRTRSAAALRPNPIRRMPPPMPTRPTSAPERTSRKEGSPACARRPSRR